MNMRTIAKRSHNPSDSHDGIHWAKYWNHFQHKRALHRKETTTVIYGHDARRGLDIGKYSIGLDSNCARGGRLSALVIEGGRTPRQSIVSVKCKKYA